MKKHLLTSVFILIFTGYAMAQLTLQKVGSKKIKVIPIGTLIEVKLPTKTSRADCDCYKAYQGHLKKVGDKTVSMILNYEITETVDENNVGIKEVKQFKQPKDSMVMQIPLTKTLAISRFSQSNVSYQNLGGVIFVLSAISNLFIAPHLDNPFGRSLRNIGYGGMALGLSTAFLKTKKVYNFEQPKNGNKTLWKLSN